MEKPFKSLKEFYPYYLTEHSTPSCRVLHFTGTFLIFAILTISLSLQLWAYLALIPFVGYGFAWIGHYFFEKNKPATFEYPFYSLAADFILFFDLVKGKQKFNQGGERPGNNRQS